MPSLWAARDTSGGHIWRACPSDVFLALTTCSNESLLHLLTDCRIQTELSKLKSAPTDAELTIDVEKVEATVRPPSATTWQAAFAGEWLIEGRTILTDQESAQSFGSASGRNAADLC